MVQSLTDTRSLRADVLLNGAFEESDLTWRVLGTLNVFRLILAVILLSLFFAGDDPRFFGDRYPAVFSATAAGYLVFSIISGLAIRHRWVTAGPQILAQVTVDIAAIVILMHASGGISSGLGGLLVVFVGAGSMILPLQVPAFFAALATIAILGEQFFSQIGGVSDTSNFSAAGVLGAIIFAISLAARPLARRIQFSEALARQRGVDLANVSELNEYIVQHLRESIVVIDTSDNVRLINASAAQLIGAPSDCHGMNIGEVSADLAAYVKTWRGSQSEVSHTELTMNAEDDSARIKAHLAPLGKGHGRSGPILVFLEDASLMNARVQQSKLASLGRLSASIAHEIRNPVGAMSHAGQLLAESEALSDDDLRLTEIIRSHAERVSHIIDNILQLSRRESSQPERFELAPWLMDFSQEFTRTLELQEGELSVSDYVQGLEVRMDPSHLRQVMWNLCDNAVKYASETGGILVELQCGQTQRSGQPYLEVLDQGHGVEPATVDKIFEPFYTDRSGGTGLGLYISRELCELNRATLVYQPRETGGSIFRIVFSDPDRWEAVED
ncbi:MAG: two-component system sensor histidine kinase PilS (NtrC family) [Woeseiaceae bacterium]|jgi:two-component system sensor histidine kinase PilS (NtrC family)